MTGLLHICASCLGLNRRNKPNNIDETDALLGDSQPQYGATVPSQHSEIDEEELRREREALEHITNEAADQMIDVAQSRSFDLQTPIHSQSPIAAISRPPESTVEDTEDEADEEERAWLEGLRADNKGSITQIHGLGQSDLTIDIGQLRRDTD